MIVLVDARYIERFGPPLARLGHVALPSVPCSALPEPEAYHPDMTVFAAGAKTVIAEPTVFSRYRTLLGEKGIKVVQGETVLSRNYPSCVAYNVLTAGGYAFHKAGCTDPVVLAVLEEAGKTLLPTRQGYARCAACTAAGGLITADRAILRTAREAGLPVLPIRPGHVSLPGYDTGFLGGASGDDGQGTLLFAGNVALHPDHAAICAFLHTRGVTPVSLDDGPLTDVGSLLMLG